MPDSAARASRRPPCLGLGTRGSLCCADTYICEPVSTSSPPMNSLSKSPARRPCRRPTVMASIDGTSTHSKKLAKCLSKLP
eukprot:9046981-Pyramimonas_sp.AAC.1